MSDSYNMDEAQDDDAWSSWDIGESVDRVSVPQQVDVEGELAHFRDQWQRELKEKQDSRSLSNQSRSQRHELVTEPSIEQQAEYLFLQGVRAEQNGRLYDAIKYYRRAVQLVPDIEFRIKDYRPRLRSERTDSESSVGSNTDFDETENLAEHFANLRASDELPICEPAIKTEMCHISAVPMEIIMYIIKWVVSSELDILSLTRLSEVCRGFYVCTKDEELWKLICEKVYCMKISRPGSYGSYINMYLKKPHVRFNGCYISRTEYFRSGEKSLDGFYRAIHVVEYFRYIKFFPGGEILMLTTPDHPFIALPKLKYNSCRYQGILHGYYKLSGDRLSAQLKRRKFNEYNTSGYRYKYRRQLNNNNNNNIETDQNYQVEFLLRDAGKRPHSQLIWNHYSIKKTSNPDHVTEFELTANSYPNLIFSRVKSFTDTSEAPLQ